jgi:hypothetical protein
MSHSVRSLPGVLLVACAARTPQFPSPWADVPGFDADTQLVVGSPGKGCDVVVDVMGVLTASELGWSGDEEQRRGTVETSTDTSPPATCGLYRVSQSHDRLLWWVRADSAYYGLEEAITAEGREPEGGVEAHPGYRWGDTPPEHRIYRCRVGTDQSPSFLMVERTDPRLSASLVIAPGHSGDEHVAPVSGREDCTYISSPE